MCAHLLSELYIVIQVISESPLAGAPTFINHEKLSTWLTQHFVPAVSRQLHTYQSNMLAFLLAIKFQPVLYLNI